MQDAVPLLNQEDEGLVHVEPTTLRQPGDSLVAPDMAVGCQDVAAGGVACDDEERSFPRKVLFAATGCGSRRRARRLSMMPA